MNNIDFVQAIITSPIIPSGAETYNGGYLSGTLGYNATVRIASGDIRNIAVGRPRQEVWKPPMFVMPLDAGTVIDGIVVNDVYYWYYVESPVVDPECTG